MKKIININLAGRVIPIEDSAYESLQRYVESLRRYFAREEGRDEIINDIESRIAELMNEKIRKGAHAVTDADIEEIIASMGRVEDFAEADAADNAGAADAGEQQTFNGSKAPKGRMYRDSSDKILGGVCAGIANYMNFDPAVVRLLFAIITFGGFGLGFLLYIVLWIILPAQHLDRYAGKRLFRNPDDQMIGGVCGGLSAYFNISANTLRLIFAAPLILNVFFNVVSGIFAHNWHWGVGPWNLAFGSITSTFILAYVVLWIVLPLAKTPYEKMEMRGEKVDVNRIWQNVQQNMGDIETKAKAWGEEVTESANRLGQRAREFTSTKGKAFAAEAGPVASGFGHAIGVLFRVLFLFIFGIIAFALFVVLITLIFGGGTMLWPLKEQILDLFLRGFWQKAFFWCTVLFFFVVPTVGFLTWVIRRIMRVKSRGNYLGWTFGGLWTLGWISLFLLISSVASDFRSEREVSTPVTLAQPVNNKMIVAVSGPEVIYNGDWFFEDEEIEGWNLTDDSLTAGNVKLDVALSRDSSYRVTLIKQSRGRNGAQAMELASRIQYSISSRDSVLDLGSGFTIAKEDKFRAQQVIVLIEVPAGKQVRFSNTMEKLHPVKVDLKRNRKKRKWDVKVDEHLSRFKYRYEVDYVMSATGQLVAADGSVVPYQPAGGIENYRYGGSDSLERVLEEKRRQQEEAEKEIKRLEELKRQRTGYRKENPATHELASLPFFSVLI